MLATMDARLPLRSTWRIRAPVGRTSRAAGSRQAATASSALIACSDVIARPGAAQEPATTGAPGSTRLPVAIAPPLALPRLTDQELRLTIDRVRDHSAAIRPASAVFAPSD